VSQRLLAIMSLLLPLRRMCSGGALTDREITVPDLAAMAAARSAARANAFYGGGAGGDDDDQKPNVKPSLPSAGGASGSAAPPAAADPGLGPVDAKPVLEAVPTADEMCAICGEVPEDAVRTPCQHWFCKACLLEALPAKASQARCPECRKPVDAARMMHEAAAADAASAAAGAGAGAGGSGAAGAGAGGSGAAGAGTAAKPTAAAAAGDAKAKPPPSPVVLRSESKLQALLRELKKMREEDATAKALVFSQFASTIEFMKERLTEEGFGYRTISGSMPLNKRAAAIEAFQKDPPTTVFLLSVRSGAVGINLTAASHVFLLEPVLNPALQAQAIGRAWRMGQQRTVVVKHLYVKNSVEERIIKLNDTRTAATGTGGGAAAALLATTDAARKGKAKVSDIAGAIRSDRQDLRLNELEMLFSVRRARRAVLRGSLCVCAVADASASVVVAFRSERDGRGRVRQRAWGLLQAVHRDDKPETTPRTLI
jgi:hypothetical protein